MERVRKQILRKDEELLSLRADLEEEYGHLLDMNRDALCNMIPDTTPGPCLFNLPPEHDVGVPHGMWIWDPKNPDVITDEVTGTVFPNDRYKEDSVLQTYWGKPQNFSFYTGKSMEYNGYHLYPSFTGMIRARKSEYMIRGAYGLALLYYLTDDIRYALKAADIFASLCRCVSLLACSHVRRYCGYGSENRGGKPEKSAEGKNLYGS